MLGSVHEVLEEGWKGFLRPVSANATDLLADLHLSPGLWVCFVLGLLGWKKGGWGLRILILASICLVALLMRAPFVTDVWRAMPVWVGRITDQWPAQRFYPILSAFAPFAALLTFERAWAQRPRISTAAICLLLVGGIWSGYEARKFLHRGYRVAASPSHSRQLAARQSTALSVYSYAMLGTP